VLILEIYLILKRVLDRVFFINLDINSRGYLRDACAT